MLITHVHINKLTDAYDWLMSLLLMGERTAIPPTEGTGPVLLSWTPNHGWLWHCLTIFQQ